MRSPEELIRELKLEGEKFDTVAILVVFENDTLPVYSIDTEALENLKELIQKRWRAYWINISNLPRRRYSLWNSSLPRICKRRLGNSSPSGLHRKAY